MKSALIGYTGLVGRHLQLHFDFDDLYNSSNIHEIRNKEFATIFCAGIPAKKWIANQHPEEDMANIQKLADILITTKAERFVLISTIDVFADVSDTTNTEEMTDHERFSNEPYGKNRRWMESFVQHHFPIFHIIRLPALFGLFLSKNIIFDMMNKSDQRMRLNLACEYQYYPLSRIGKDIRLIIKRNLPVVHLFSEKISVSKIKQWMESIHGHTHHFCIQYHDFYRDDNKKIVYDCRTIYPELFLNKGEIHAEFTDFVFLWIFWYRYFIAMPTCITTDETNQTVQDTIKTFHKFDISRLEVAPAHFWGPEWESIPCLLETENANEVYRIHGLFYKKEWNMWNDYRDVSDFLQSQTVKFCELPQFSGITMGSPTQRLRMNNNDYEIAIVMHAYDENIPNPLQWELNAPEFGTDTFHSKEFFKCIKRHYPRFSMVLDTGSCQMVNEDPIAFFQEFQENIHHIHFSTFSKFMTNDDRSLWTCQQSFFQYLLLHEYRGYITVEIPSFSSIQSVLQYLRRLLINDYYENS